VRSSPEVLELAVTEPPAVAEADRRAAAFLRLADEHLDSAYRLATAILHDPVDAQDATHDAFERAWGKWSTLRDESRFEAWFGRILVNECRDRLRRGRRWRPTDISAEMARPNSTDEFSEAHERDLIRTSLSRLTPDQQIVVALRFYADLTVADIAERLNVPQGTVASRLHYALKRLEEVIRASEKESRP